jgi:LEA14-like dessication related protein
MKRLKTLLILLVIINIILSSILITNIQLFKSPDVTVDIDILDINSEEIQLGSTIIISNSNSFDLIVSDLEILILAENGEKIGTVSIKGGKVPGNAERIFRSKDALSFKSDTFEAIESIISATVGINVLGLFTKTIPLKIKASVSIAKVLEALIPPDIKINFNFDDITNKGIDFSTIIDFYNPTSFEFYVDTFYLDITNEKNESVGKIEFQAGKINAKSSEVFSSKGIINFEAFDAEVLLINVFGVVGAKIAGATENISFSVKSLVHIPDIKSFAFSNDPLDFSMPIQYRLTPRGILVTIGLRIYNPSEVEIVAKNLVCTISRIDNNKISFLGQEKMESCKITGKEAACIETQILIPYTKYLFSGSKKLLPDWILLNIEGDFSIAGTRQLIPFSLNAYEGFNFLKYMDPPFNE